MPQIPIKIENKFINIETLDYNKIKKLLNIELKENRFIELKEKFNNSVKDKIPHLVASFANEDGGIVLIGITDDGEIDGIEKEDFDQIIGNKIEAKLSPIPDFKLKFIPIPDSNNGILVIFIMKGFDTPYLVDGKAYRRIGNNTIGACPIKNRYDLEKLFERNTKHKSQFKNYCERRIKVHEKDNNLNGSKKYYSVLDLYLLLPNSNQFAKIDFDNDEVMDKIKSIIRSTHKFRFNDTYFGSINIDFSSINYSHDSIIIRQTDSETERNKGITIQIHRNGWIKLHRTIFETDLNEVYSLLAEKGSLSIDEMRNYHFLNGTRVTEAVLVAYAIFFSVKLHFFPECSSYIPVLHFDHVQRRVLFINRDEFQKYYIENGLPFSEQNEYIVNEAFNSIRFTEELDLADIVNILMKTGNIFGFPGGFGTSIQLIPLVKTLADN